jgi:hypothetical protein
MEDRNLFVPGCLGDYGMRGRIIFKETVGKIVRLVVTMVNVKVAFWDVMSCSLIDWHLHHRGTSTCFPRVEHEGLWFCMGVQLGL